MFPISSTTPPLINNFPSHESSEVISSERVDHLAYISGRKAELWKELVKRGIIDVYGNVTPRFSCLPLPLLEETEINVIQEHLFKPITIRLSDGRSFNLYVVNLIKLFVHNMTSKCIFKIDDIHLIGGFVTYILFSHSNYVKRIFESLEISDLFDPELCVSPLPLPPDIDIRMRVKKWDLHGFTNDGRYIPPSADLKPKEMEGMRNYIIQVIAAHFYTQNSSCEERISIYSEILNTAFKTLSTAYDQSNLFQVISFRESPIDWVIYDHLIRLSVFSNELYVPLSAILGIDQRECRPSSFQANPLSAFFYTFFKFIKAEFPQQIDAKGWPRLMTKILRGYTQMQKREDVYDQTLEQILFHTFAVDCNKANGGFVLTCQTKISDWLEKHHTNDPFAALFFLLNAVQFLEDRIDEKDIFNILTVLCKDLQFEGEKVESQIAVSIIRLLFFHKVSYKNILCLLQAAAFLIENLISRSPQEVAVTLASQNYEEPVLKLEIAGYTLQLPCNPCEALSTLCSLDELFLKAGPEVEYEMNKLFLLLCKPIEVSSPIKKEKLAHLCVDYDIYYSSILELVNKQKSIFLIYCGIIYLGSLQDTEPLVRLYCYQNLLDILQYNQDDPTIYHQLEGFMGGGTLPPLGREDFEEAWIKSLFEDKSDIPDLAFITWKKYLQKGGRLDFSLDLITTLLTVLPGQAGRLFRHLDSVKELDKEPEIAVACIFSCGRFLRDIGGLNFSHKLLLNSFAKSLVRLLAYPGFEPENKEKFSEDLAWFIFWCTNKEQTETALALLEFQNKWGGTQGAQIPLKLQFNILLGKKDFQGAAELLKTGIETQKFLEADKIYLICQFFLSSNFSLFDPALGSLFIKLFIETPISDEDYLSVTFFLLKHTQVSFIEKLQLAYTLNVTQPDLCSDELQALLVQCLELSENDTDFYWTLMFFSKNSLSICSIDPSFEIEFLYKSLAKLSVSNNQQGRERQRAKVIERLIRLYATKVSDMLVSVWDLLFTTIQTYRPEKCLPLLNFLEKTIDLQSRPELYQILFATAGAAATKKINSNILPYIIKPEKLSNIFGSKVNPLLAFYSHAYLMLCGCAFVKEDSSLIPHLKRIFVHGEAYYGVVTDSVCFLNNAPQDHVSVKAHFDANYLSILFSSERKLLRIEGREWLTKRLKSLDAYPDNYWSTFFGRMAVILAESKLIRELDRVFGFFEQYPFDIPNIIPVLSFLIEHITTNNLERLAHAMDLWCAWSKGNVLDIPDFWRYGLLLIEKSIDVQYFVVDIGFIARFALHLDMFVVCIDNLLKSELEGSAQISFRYLKEIVEHLFKQAKEYPKTAKLLLQEAIKVLKKMRSIPLYTEENSSEIDKLLATYKELLLKCHN